MCVGKGLGKHESGITEALKPKLKFDTAGIGHRDEDWNNWWENAFNKAADSILVDSQTHGVCISLSKESERDNCPVKPSNENKSKCSVNYGNFLKTSTLLNGNLIEESTASLSKKENVEESITNIPLTDEELFKICGGRTAHKGARHGLTLNGKLKRIAQQEQDLLGKDLYANALMKIQTNGIESEGDERETVDKKSTVVSIASFKEEVPVLRESKSTRKKNKRRINDLTHQLNILCNISDSDEKNEEALTKRDIKQEREEKHRKRKRKKERRRGSIFYDIESVEREEADNESNDTSFPASPKIGKQITKKNSEKQLSDHIDKEFDNISICRKKKKKKKRQDNRYEIIIDKCSDEELHGSKAKKLKRSHKSDSALQLLKKNEEIKTDCKFHTLLLSNEIPLETQEIRDSSVSAAESLTEVAETYLKNNAYHLNAKITKKKQAKLRKKEQVKLSKITDSLKAVHLNTEECSEGKNTKNILKTVIGELTATDISTKKSLKKRTKNKQNK